MFISLKLCFSASFAQFYIIIDNSPSLFMYRSSECTEHYRHQKINIPTVTQLLCKFVSILRFLCYIGAHCTGGAYTWRILFCSSLLLRAEIQNRFVFPRESGTRFSASSFFSESVSPGPLSILLGPLH